MRTFFLCLTLLGASLSGCDVLTGTTTTVYGTVTDQRTGAPVEGVSVVLGLQFIGRPSSLASTVTDARGRYRLSTDFNKANLVDLYVNHTAYGAMVGYNPAYGTYMKAVSKRRTTRLDVQI